MGRFNVGWYRFVPFLGYHHVVMILIVGSIVMTSKLQLNCTSRTSCGDTDMRDTPRQVFSQQVAHRKECEACTWQRSPTRKVA